jgi:hypothetical protein
VVRESADALREDEPTMYRAFAFCLAIACTTDGADTGSPSDTTPTVPPTTPPTTADALNVWFIDDEEHPALYASLNCEMFDAALMLNGSDAAGTGTIQLLLGAFPTADATLTVIPDFDPVAGEIRVSIGRDREAANQFVPASGTVDVRVVDNPRAILVDFEDLAGETDGGDAALLTAHVGAREGSFFGACDFDDL